MHSMLQNLKRKCFLTLGIINKYINHYSRVKPDNIIMLRHCYA